VNDAHDPEAQGPYLATGEAQANGVHPEDHVDVWGPFGGSSPLERPEVALGAAFAGGLLLALLLKRARS
jgi:hypothetical protein